MKEVALPIPAHLTPIPAPSLNLALPPNACEVIRRGLARALNYANSNTDEAGAPDRSLPDAATIASGFCAEWPDEHWRVEELAHHAALMAGLPTGEYRERVRGLAANRAAIDQIMGRLPDATRWRIATGRHTLNEAQRELEIAEDALHYLKVYLSAELSSIKRQRGRPTATVKAEITLAVARWWLRRNWTLYFRPRRGAKPESVFMALLSAATGLLLPDDPRCLTGKSLQSLLKDARASVLDLRAPVLDPRPGSGNKSRD